MVPGDDEALTPDESYRAVVVRVAKYYGVPPQDVRGWKYQDILDTLEIMEADGTISDIERQRAGRTGHSR